MELSSCLFLVATDAQTGLFALARAYGAVFDNPLFTTD
jgi:hypothetical protein